MKSGVLLVNLGTPAAPTAAAIRAWLREFLSDRRVVDLPRALWLPVLYGVILPLRPRKLEPAYRGIWTPAGSPLLAISRQQQAELQKVLPVPVALAMRYGEPSIAQGLSELKTRGAERIVVLPLYPQYSTTTTASVQDLTGTAQVIESYHDHPGYIEALAASLRAHWQQHGRGEHLLLSYHGLPQKLVDQGDPYARQCEATSRLLAAALDLKEGEWTLAYQSRVGRAQWLQPYTEETLDQLGRRGVKTLDVICPGFSADCLETLEEIAQRYRERFAAAGGELRYVPALNAGAAHIAALKSLLEPVLATSPAISGT